MATPLFCTIYSLHLVWTNKIDLKDSLVYNSYIHKNYKWHNECSQQQFTQTEFIVTGEDQSVKLGVVSAFLG